MSSRIKEIKTKLNEVKLFKSLKTYRFKPRDPKTLKRFLTIKANERQTDLNDIDVSNLNEIVPFGDVYFFRNVNFYVDEWDVSNIFKFYRCFANCEKFNSDLSNWDVSNGKDFGSFFVRCLSFNNEVNHFNISNAKKVERFFEGCLNFDKEVYNFKFNVKMDILFSFFESCIRFNRDVSMWDVSNVSNFNYMFYGCSKFKQDLSNWDVSNAKSWFSIFRESLMEKHPELMPEEFRESYLKQ